MFLTGLMFGSIIIFMLCYKERVMDTQLSLEASVGIGLGIGMLCGLVTMLVRSVGLFMVGLLLGLLLALASLVVLEEFYHPRTVWLPLGVLLGSGMLFAVLTLQWQRCFTTLSTAVFGSAVVTVTVDYLSSSSLWHGISLRGWRWIRLAQCVGSHGWSWEFGPCWRCWVFLFSGRSRLKDIHTQKVSLASNCTERDKTVA